MGKYRDFVFVALLFDCCVSIGVWACYLLFVVLIMDGDIVSDMVCFYVDCRGYDTKIELVLCGVNLRY
jgi:uncharacterized membrane protein YpjA